MPMNVAGQMLLYQVTRSRPSHDTTASHKPAPTSAEPTPAEPVQPIPSWASSTIVNPDGIGYHNDVDSVEDYLK